MFVQKYGEHSNKFYGSDDGIGQLYSYPIWQGALPYSVLCDTNMIIISKITLTPNSYDSNKPQICLKIYPPIMLVDLTEKEYREYISNEYINNNPNDIYLPIQRHQDYIFDKNNKWNNVWKNIQNPLSTVLGALYKANKITNGYYLENETIVFKNNELNGRYVG